MTTPATGVADPPPAQLFGTALLAVATALRDDCDPQCSLTLHEWETRNVFVALLERPLALRLLARVADPYATDPAVREAIVAPLRDEPTEPDET